MNHAFALLVLSLAACGRPASDQRLIDSYQALAERYQRHLDEASTTDDADTIAAETDGYCADMADRTDDMQSACDDMMGRMHDGQRVLDSLDEIRAEVDRHCAAMDELFDADGQHDECDTHEQVMDSDLDQMGKAVDDETGAASETTTP